MTSQSLPAGARAEPDAMWEWALGATILMTVARLVAVRLSPLQLYADEAQYWLWSRDLAFGYFTKPPLIAWLIRLTTLGGDAEPFVRLSAPLLHAAAGLFVFRAARRLYDGRVALFSLLVYGLMPAVQLGSFVISTDTPLMACLAAVLWAYAALQESQSRGTWLSAAGFGLALGLAFLAKYAALYAVIGVALHLAFSRTARRAWTPVAAGIAFAAFALLAAPNLIWNAANGLASFHHLAGEAAWGARKGGPVEGAIFLASQFGVFGPLPFTVLIGGGVWLAWRRRLETADALLLSWTVPALVIVLAQAFIAGAKANWAAAAFAPGSILVAAWMLRWSRPRLLIAALAGHALLAVVGLVGVTTPSLADRVGLSSVLRGVRGGRELTDLVIDQAKAASLVGPLSAVAIDQREFFNTAAYYGRDYFGKDGPPLKAWLATSTPLNEGQLVSPLTPAFGARVLLVSRDSVSIKAMRAQFQQAGETDVGDVWLGPKHRLDVQMFVGQGFRAPQTR